MRVRTARRLCCWRAKATRGGGGVCATRAPSDSGGGRKLRSAALEVVYRRLAAPANASQRRRAIHVAMLALAIPALYLVTWASALNDPSAGRLQYKHTHARILAREFISRTRFIISTLSLFFLVSR